MPAAEEIGGSRPRAGLARHGALTLVANTLILGLGLVTGMLVARTLGVAGRGQLAAVMTAPQLLGWIFAIGCAPAAAYHLARRPAAGGRLLGTWLVLVVPLGGCALLAGEAILPWLLSAQSPATLHLARVFLLTVVVVPLAELSSGVLLGDHDFAFYNGLRLAQPLATALAYVVLWQLDHLSVMSAVAASACSGAAGTLVATARVLRRHGVRRPSFPLARSTAWYGLRAHGANVAGIVNARLDLLLVPAFLGASSVGLYSVATNVSWVVVAVTGAASALVLPAAARQGPGGTVTVVRSLQGVVVIGAAIAAALGLLASVLVDIVYGAAFDGSVEALRVLLPGCVLAAGSGVVCSGLCACNQPFLAAVAQAAGAAVTVGGLLLFLARGGILAAALVSTASYATTFLVAIVAYRRTVGLAWRELLPCGQVAPATALSPSAGA